MKLTKSQLSALKDIGDTPGKSGAFYADLGSPAASLYWLSNKSLVRAEGHAFTSFRHWQYWPTDEGKLFLETLKRDED